MAQISIGKTGLRIEQSGFGALPIQRISKKEAVHLLRKALDGGMTYYDTARAYSDSEEKLGEAFDCRRDQVIIATKTHAANAGDFRRDLETSLRTLKTDRIDLYQFHNPRILPVPGDETGLFDAMLDAKRLGKIRSIGITSHRLDVAQKAVQSGLFDTLMFPFSYLCDEKDLELSKACKNSGMGFIAMKALSGGLITNSAAAYAWMTRFGHVIPVWGIQRESELNEFLSYLIDPPLLTDEMAAIIETDRKELLGNFCRGCGYCMPCPQGIEISMCARSSLLLRRAPLDKILSESGQAMMRKVESCVMCGQCAAKCPYGLDTPALLKMNYQDYKEVLAGKPLQQK